MYIVMASGDALLTILSFDIITLRQPLDVNERAAIPRITSIDIGN